MTNPYPPPPKRLVRSTSNRFIGGVCGGVADYLNMDANLVRILTVLITLFTGIPVILYILALFLLPEGQTTPSAPPPVTGSSTYAGPFTGPQSTTPPPAYAPYPEAGAAAGTRPSADDAVWGSEGPPWEQRTAQPAGSVNPPPTTPPPATPTPPPAAEPEAPSEPEAPVVPPKDDEPPKPS